MSRTMRAGLWGAFALLLVIGGIRLLFGCALAVPAFLQLQYCPVSSDTTSLDRERARRDALEERIHQAEIALARVPPCDTCIPGAPGTPSSPASVQPEFLLALDISSSMNREATVPGQSTTGSPTKIEIVKRDLPPELDAFGKRLIGLMEFGRTCDERRSSIYEQGWQVARRVREIQLDKDGGTNMAAVLRDAAGRISAAPDGNYYGNILIVTDVAGGECPGEEDPCAAAKDIARQKPHVAINVIDLENADRLRCVSDATGGRFFARGSSVDLRAMIQEARTFPGPTTCVPSGNVPAPVPPPRKS